jgi:WD40 repeat protein
MVGFLRACSSVLVLVLASCGGGGGDGGAPPNGGGAGGGGSTGNFPTLVPSGSFQLPAFTEPPDRSVTAGVQRGEVRTGAGTTAPEGLTVELLDASNAASPRVLGTGLTDSSGAFSINGDVTSVGAANRLLRVEVGGGVVLRAFASGWTEITPGTEVAVQELTRLQKAGRFSGVATGPLAASQESLSLVWLGSYVTLPPGQAVASLLVEMRFQAAWNSWLDRLSKGATTGAGDIAVLVPVSDVTWPSLVTKGGLPPAALRVQSGCSSGLASDNNSCAISAASDPDLREAFVVDLLGAKLREETISTDPLSNLLSQVGDLPLLEFPAVVGKRVLYDDPRFVLSADTNIHASVKITRRTYPAQSTSALGGSPQAIRVVLDYEIAMLNMTNGAQTDLLVREQRWFTPKGGRIRIDSIGLARSGTQVVNDSLSVVANSLIGVTTLAPTIPFAGVVDARALPLRHYQAVYSAAFDRVYASSPDDGGKILELSATTLDTLRTLSVGVVPRSLAVSSDGQRLFAGLDDGSIAEWSVATLTQLSRTVPMVDPYGVAIDRVFSLAIDPFDSRRVLALVGASSGSGRGAVAAFRNGDLLLRDAPRFNALGWGWGYYTPFTIAWTSVPNEFLSMGIRGPNQLNRFSVGNTVFGELLSVDFGEEVGTIEIGGEIVTDKGSVLDGATFANKRSLTLAPLGLRDCSRMEAGFSLCRVKDDAFAPPNLVLLTHATSDFVGVYQPAVATVTNGCPERGVRENSLGLDDLRVASMGNRRLLASSLSAGADGTQRCNLQIWALRGVTQ